MIHAVAHVRPMRGGAQSHLVLADDGHHYVVKVLNNPQHPRILANEWLASGIARALGLPVPPFAAIDIAPALLAVSPGFIMRFGGRTVPVSSGPAFGSRIPTARPNAPIYDYLPEPGLDQVENLAEFAGMLALDKWLCNCDGRQVIFCRLSPKARMRVFCIDFGFCFNAGDWTFPDSPFRGLYCRHAVYAHLRSSDDFEPWLSRIEGFTPSALTAIAFSMPEAWRAPAADLDALLTTLLARRPRVRTLLDATRACSRTPFENWGRPALVPSPILNPSCKGEVARTHWLPLSGASLRLRLNRQPSSRTAARRC